MTRTQAWSQSVLIGSTHGALAAFQESLPVQLIATGRSEFRTCLPDEALSAVVERNRVEGFDFIPVMVPGAPSGQTVAGLLDVADVLTRDVLAQSVRDFMQPLGEGYLIGADASILTFIRDADRHPFRFVVSGREVSGLVSISDLQRLPVRAALFAIVTQLEMTMADVIRRECSRPDAWMALLSQGRAEKVRQNVARAKAADTLVDRLLYTEFCDKVTIIAKAWPFSGEVSQEKRVFRKEMEDIQSLRDSLAHGNDYASTCDAANNLCERVRRMDGWTNALAELESKPSRTASRGPLERD